MMNRLRLKRVFTQTMEWTALFVLCSVVALAQEAAPAAVPASAPTAAAVARSDGEIEMDVVHALDASKALKSDLITAATIQGEVTLSGTVSSEASSELAETIVSRLAGVTKVTNHLTVGNPQAQPEPPAPPAAESQPSDAGTSDSAGEASSPAMNDGPMPVPNETPEQAQMRAEIRAEVQAQLRAQRQARLQALAQNRQYPPVPPPPPAYEAPKGPVTLPQGTMLQLRTSEAVNSKFAKDGTPVQFMVIQDVTVGGVLAIPRGAVVHGVVSEVKQAGALKGSAVLALTVTSLDLGGQSYALATDQFKVKGPGKGGETANHVFGGALLGAMIGGFADRGRGAAIGAAAGAGAGTAASAATPGPGVWIPAEAKVDFRLDKPLTVTPVGSEEASRLAQGLYPGGPTLYRRGYDPYGHPYYVYPPVFFRPYYMVGGGFYYWR